MLERNAENRRQSYKPYITRMEDRIKELEKLSVESGLKPTEASELETNRKLLADSKVEKEQAVKDLNNEFDERLAGEQDADLDNQHQ